MRPVPIPSSSDLHNAIAEAANKLNSVHFVQEAFNFAIGRTDDMLAGSTILEISV